MGEAVAVVVAEDPYLAADAVEAVASSTSRCRWHRRPGATAPALVHDGWRDNVAGVTRARTGDAARAFAEADVVVEAHLAYPRVTGMPIEGRAVLAASDAESGRLRVVVDAGALRRAHRHRAWRSGCPRTSIRVIVPDVGGGFGIKGHVYPEEVLVAAVARRLGRPVKWVETRREHFLTAAGDRDQVHRARIGVRRDGTIVALETVFTRDHGAFPTLGGAMTANTINHLVGPYRVPNYRAGGPTSSPTRPSPPPIGAPAGPRPHSSSTACSTGRRGRSAWIPRRSAPAQPGPARRDAVRHRAHLP